jgi:hypothetical protein
VRLRTVAVSTIYYALVCALLFGVLFEMWSKVLPKHVAGQIGHNSEGYFAVLIMAAWIQFVRPRLAGTRAEWPLITAVSIGALALGCYMVWGTWASRFATLNEGAFAVAVLIPYVHVRRPLPRYLAGWLTAATIIFTIATIHWSVTVDIAETYGMVILAVAGLDMVDRGILDPNATTSALRRWIWYALLVVAPVYFSLAEYHWHAGGAGVYGTAIRWLVRINESFIYALLIELFFAVGLGLVGRRASRTSAEKPPELVSAA